jgi:hypothetical protein
LKKRSYQTSRIDSAARQETLEEKMARVRREVEEIRMEMVNEDKPEQEVTEWASLVLALSNNTSSASMVTTRVQKLASKSPSPSTGNVYLIPFQVTVDYCVFIILFTFRNNPAINIINPSINPRIPPWSSPHIVNIPNSSFPIPSFFKT